MRGILVVARLSAMLWIREIAHTLRVSRALVQVGIVAAALLTVAFGVVLAAVAGIDLSPSIPEQVRSTILTTAFGGGQMTTGLIAVVVAIASPPSSALGNLLQLMPVGRVASRVGTQLPSLALALFSGLAFSSTAIAVVIRSSASTGDAIVGSIALLASDVFALTTATAIFWLSTTLAGRVLRLPHAYAAPIGGIVAIAAVLAPTLPGLLERPTTRTAGAFSGLLPHRVFADSAGAGSGAAWAAAGAYLVLAAMLTIASAVVRRGAPVGSPWMITVRSRPPRRGGWRGRVWMELLLTLRAPQYTLAALIALGGPWALLLLGRVPLARMLIPTLSSALIVLPFLLAVYAVGRTLPAHWVASVATGRPRAWIAPKAVAAFVGAVPLAAIGTGVTLSTGTLTLEDLAAAVPHAAAGLALALLAGALLPASDRQPLSTVAGGLALALLYASTTLLVGWLSQHLELDAALGLLVVTVVAMGAFVAVSSRLSARGGVDRV
jgi:hypothetical protein